jgi:acyl-CoA thioesterase YciA
VEKRDFDMTGRIGPPDIEPAIRIVAMPADANPSGDIFGGWIMSMMDMAGGTIAFKRARGRVVTVAVNEFTFHVPVLVGDIVSCYAEIRHIGRTSIRTWVEVWVQRKGGGDLINVTEGEFTYVCIDEDRKPRPVPPEETS